MNASQPENTPPTTPKSPLANAGKNAGKTSAAAPIIAAEKEKGGSVAEITTSQLPESEKTTAPPIVIPPPAEKEKAETLPAAAPATPPPGGWPAAEVASEARAAELGLPPRPEVLTPEEEARVQAAIELARTQENLTPAEKTEVKEALETAINKAVPGADAACWFPVNYSYFRKGLVNTPFAVRGLRVPFEILADNVGVIAVNPGHNYGVAKKGGGDVYGTEIIQEMEKAASERRSGINVISEERYNDLKKNLALIPSLGNSRRSSALGDGIRIAPTNPPKKRGTLQPNGESVAGKNESSPGTEPGVGGAEQAAAGVRGGTPAARFEPQMGRHQGGNLSKQKGKDNLL